MSRLGLPVAFLTGAALAWVTKPLLDQARQGRVQARAGVREGQRRQAQDMLEQAINDVPAGIALITRTGDVVLANEAAHTLGLIANGKPHPEVWKRMHAVFNDRTQHTVDIDARHARRAGNPNRAVHTIITPLTMAGSNTALIYATDESETLRMESARRDFVANVSHELKTPVGAMALLAEALVESKDDPDTVEHFGTKLTTEAHRMAALINELIALSKLQGAEALPNMDPVIVDDVIDEAIKRTQLAAEGANITVDRGQRSGVVVLGDKTLLVTAVSNLISNAVNYSPPEAPVRITQDTTSDSARIHITDRGIGIAAEDQKRVFERFFRVDKARSRETGGTGLGLAIVKHVAVNHGGSISLQSKPGQGSTFTLELPISGSDSAKGNEGTT